MLPAGTRAAFEDAFQRLLIDGVRRQVPAILGLPDPLPFEFARYLLSIAARLSLSSERQDRTVAYEVIALVLELDSPPHPLVLQAADLVLARLGNFPARTLTRDRFASVTGESVGPGLILALEALTREVENTVELRQRELTLTDFQRRLFDALDRWNSVSVSAPTSAGKSFLLSLDVIRHHLRSSTGAVVFVVPTRALIRQVMRDVIAQLRDFGANDVAVLCVPEPPSEQSVANGIVYVLTQERLTTLLSLTGKTFSVSMLVVDEAQEVGDGGRGIILQSAIEQLLTKHPQARVLFASPLRRNPGFLLTLFGRTEQGEFFVERSSPVAQNIVLVRTVPRQPQKAQFELVREEGVLQVAQADLPFRFRIETGRTQPQLFANFCVHLTQPQDSTLVYVNEPSQAESVAAEIASLIPSLPEINPRIGDLVYFLEENVHKAYPLIECLKHGVAFHYGAMPDIIRVAVEDLFREGIIRFVCCTSTLLQGVNLPAKNVVIYRPTRGRGKPLDKGAFWNLAGRAGRLMREYAGNVWCIAPNEWELNPLDGERLVEVRAAFQDELLTNASAVAESATDTNRAAENEATLLSDQAFAKVFADYALNDRMVAESPLCNDANRVSCEGIDRACHMLLDSKTLPNQIFQQHSSTLPYRIEELAEVFRSSGDLEIWLPQHPYQTGSYDRLKMIFEILEKVFFKTGSNSYLYHTLLAYRWMTGRTLRQLIADQIGHDKVPDEPRSVSKAVRSRLKDIQQHVRHRYVKYTRIYGDVLQVVLAEGRRDDLSARVSPLHVYLEYGACSETLIHLMGLGLSRTSAIMFASASGLPDNLDWEQCRRVAEESDLRRMALPGLVSREIWAIRRRAEASSESVDIG